MPLFNPPQTQWVEVTGTSQTVAGGFAYLANNASLITFTLPASPVKLDVFQVAGLGAGGWRIAQNALQQIIWKEGGVDGTHETTIGTGGRLDSTDDRDGVTLLCSTGGTSAVWEVLAAKGNISLT